MHTVRTTQQIDESHVSPIDADRDILIARERGRALAAALGFPPADRVLVAAVITELASNIVRYAGHGQISVSAAEHDGARGITVVATDRGHGIPDPELVLENGYPTSRGLGLGLPGVRRLMDEFDIASDVETGTTVTVTKWMSR